jgi:hypothetical protein
MLTGCSPNEFIIFIVKECVDNALDKKNVKSIDVQIRTGDNITVSITDDGYPPISRETLMKLLDFEKAPSTKRGFKRISRGVQGNAFQCCAGLSYALWNDRERPEHTVEIQSNGYLHKIAFKVTEEGVSVLLNTEELRLASDMQNLTKVHFVLPLHAYDSPLYVVSWIAFLNQHVTITYRENDFEEKFESRWKSPPFISEDAGDIHWYNYADFQSLAREFKGMTVLSFVTMFKRFKHRGYGGKVLQLAGIPQGMRISELDQSALNRLFETMKSTSKPLSPRRLPSLGDFLRTKRYRVKRGLIEKNGRVVPFVLEVFSFPSEELHIIEAINFTASIHRPFTQWAWNTRKGKKDLRDLIGGRNEIVLVHLVCPNLTWLAPSKGQIEEVEKGASFKESLISAIEGLHKKTLKCNRSKLREFLVKVYEKYGPLNARQYAYQAEKEGLIDTSQGKAGPFNFVNEVLVELRKEGILPWEAVLDSSREFDDSPIKGLDSAEEIFKQKMEELMNYPANLHLPLWQYQPKIPIIFTEKEGLLPYFNRTAAKWEVRVYPHKGQFGLGHLHNIVFPWIKKLLEEEREVHILYLGDCDDEGFQIPLKLIQELESYFGFVEYDQRDLYPRLSHGIINQGSPLKFKRIALLPDQVKKYNLSVLQINPKSTIARKFVDYKCELEALDPLLLSKLIEEEIQKCWDEKAELMRKQREDGIKSELLKHIKESINY